MGLEMVVGSGSRGKSLDPNGWLTDSGLLSLHSFESRNACEEVIKTFNNTPIAKNPGEEHLVQIRYADTQDQKQLKQQTTLARQYRTAEYEQQTQARGSFYNARLNGVSVDGPASDGDFESYLQNTTG